MRGLLRIFILLLQLTVATHSFCDPIHSSSSAFTSLEGTILCGYQGWFSCQGDGSNQGWKHYTANSMFEPGACSIDMWPDVRELDSDELFATSFTNPNGSKAQTYSSYKRKTVMRHFRWMEEYGIDGVVLQRFVTNIKSNNSLRAFNDTVLRNVMAGAQQHNRAWCIMYDLTSMKSADTTAIKEDWKRIINSYNVTTGGVNQPYLYHRGKPLICLWGVGFDDGRHDPSSVSSYSMDAIRRLVRFFKDDPVYGSCSVLLGVNYKWRSLTGKSYIDDDLFGIIRMADVVNPWLVGRIKTTSDMSSFGSYIQGDLGWCGVNGVDYIPCAFPGFSWLNMAFRDSSKSTNIIGRAGGDFLWKQMHQAITKGVKQIYATMFDEVDEATALFKVTNAPPNNINGNNTPNVTRVGNYPASVFQTLEGLPSDHYLWMVGEAARMLRKESPLSSVIPLRSDKFSLGQGVVLAVQLIDGGVYGLSYTGELLAGKLYCSSPYVTEYGAPSYGMKRNARYFNKELTEDGLAVYGSKDQIVTVVRVNDQDEVVGYGTLALPVATAVESVKMPRFTIIYSAIERRLYIGAEGCLDGEVLWNVYAVGGQKVLSQRGVVEGGCVSKELFLLSGIYFVEVCDRSTKIVDKIVIN